MTRKILLLFSFCCVVHWITGQVPSNPIGINPPSLKWQQIKTDKVQVIFPEGNDLQGQRVANMVHYLWERDHVSIGEKNQPVTILLQNQTVIPNGFVTVGPFRSEFYLTPPQFNCTTDWLDILAIHEYRHVQQFGNSRRGITQFFRSLLGSWTWGGFTATALPRWFFEGDAVGTETALTSSGRGRLPAFEMEYRALRLNGLDYSYEKAAAGSYKDFVPDWYGLGYYLTTHARTHYGKDIWGKVVKDAVQYKGLFYPLSSSLKRHTGLNTKALYKKTFQELDSLWQPGAIAKSNLPKAVQWNTKSKKTVTHYTNPHFIGENIIVVEKRAFDENPTYYQIDANGNEKRMTQSGRIAGAPNSTLSVGGLAICWSEYDFDLRWSNRTYSVIRTYNRGNNQKKQITTQSKYFSPALNQAGDKIVAVSTDEAQHYKLVILDANNGELIRELPNPNNWFYMYPRWAADEDQIVVVAQKGEVNELQWVDANTGKTTPLLPATSYQITHPYSQGEYVYFSGAYSGINNIYAVKVGAPTLYQITDDMLGAFQPSVSADGTAMVYSAFSPEGYNIMKIDLNPADWRAFDVAPAFGMSYYEALVEQEGGSIVEKVPNNNFSVKKFGKLSGLINPHSLLPTIEHPLYGASILSDNKFSTLSAEGTAYYNVNDREWTALAGLSYAEFFPIVNVDYAHLNRSSVFTNLSSLNDTTLLQTNYIEEWKEDRLSAGISVPLTFSKGNVFHRLDFIGNYQNIAVNPDGNFDSPSARRDTIIGNKAGINGLRPFFQTPLEKVKFNALDLRLLWRSLDRQALQQLNPRWGLVLDGRYRTTLGAGDFSTDVLQLRGDVYLPGLAKTHSFYINTMLQSRGYLDNYRFSDFFVYPRGYNSILADEFYKIGVNYSLPLWYPDLAIGSLAFVKRVKANFFYDFGRSKLKAPFNVVRNVRSLGVELGFDVRAIRLLDIDFGLRYSYLLDELSAPNGQQHQFDFFLISIGG